MILQDGEKGVSQAIIVQKIEAEFVISIKEVEG